MNGSQENCQSEGGSGIVLSVPEEFCQIGGVGGVEPVMRRVPRSLSGGGSVEWSGGGEAPGAERNRSTSRKAERTRLMTGGTEPPPEILQNSGGTDKTMEEPPGDRQFSWEQSTSEFGVSESFCHQFPEHFASSEDSLLHEIIL